MKKEKSFERNKLFAVLLLFASFYIAGARLAVYLISVVFPLPTLNKVWIEFLAGLFPRYMLRMAAKILLFEVPKFCCMQLY